MPLKKVKITVMKKARYDDLIEAYERPISNPCDMKVGQTFLFDGKERPAGMCESAWERLSPFALALARGGKDFYGDWMKNRASAMISCDDGFRPVTFYLEAIDETPD